MTEIEPEASGEQPQVNTYIQIFNTQTNEVEIENKMVAAPGEVVEPRTARVYRFLIAIGKGALWCIRNPEWFLKWALTLLAIRLFLDQGLTLETLQRLRKPDQSPDVLTPQTGSPPAVPSMPSP